MAKDCEVWLRRRRYIESKEKSEDDKDEKREGREAVQAHEVAIVGSCATYFHHPTPLIGTATGLLHPTVHTFSISRRPS